MVVPGAIHWRDTSGIKRKRRVQHDTASQRNAAQLKLEADDAINLLEQFLPAAGLPERNPPSPSPSVQGFEYEPNADDDHQEEYPPERLAQYLRSRTYREKRAQNAELWNDVLPSLFVEYMRLQPKTMAWGHPAHWNKDWHACDCTVEHVRYRDIDMVDIISKL